jgi:hypothetical protein
MSIEKILDNVIHVANIIPPSGDNSPAFLLTISKDSANIGKFIYIQHICGQVNNIVNNCNLIVEKGKIQLLKIDQVEIELSFKKKLFQAYKWTFTGPGDICFPMKIFLPHLLCPTCKLPCK